MHKVLEKLAITTHWPVLVAVLVLSGVGIVTLWSTSPAEGQRQLLFLGIALVCMICFQWVDYRRLTRYAWLFYFAALLLIGYTVLGALRGGPNPLPGVSNRNGAYNWIAFGTMTLQPAELMKIGFIMALASYLRFRSNYRTLGGLLIPVGLAAVPMVMILKQPDLGTALVFIPALLAMLYAAGAKVRHMLLMIGGGALLIPVAYFMGSCPRPDCQVCPSIPLLNKGPSIVKHYQRERVWALFLDDPQTLAGVGFQQQQALIAFGSGGLGGKGAGNIPAGRRVPEARNDMIFALIGEQFGFSGASIVIVAYLVLFAAGIEIASNTKEPMGRLIAVGIVAALAGQTFLNLAVAVKLFPVTGVTLPFISAGGSSLIASFMAAGLLLNIGQTRPIMLGPEAFDYDHADD